MAIFRWAYPRYILYFITSLLHYTLTKSKTGKGLTPCDFVAVGMGRADGLCRKKGCAEWQGLRISNLSERLKAQLVDSPAPHFPQKDRTCV